MTFPKVFRGVLYSVLMAAAVTACGGEKPLKNDAELEPMVIERGDTSERDPENIWDEALNTHLLLRIQRVVFTTFPGSEVKLEIETEIPLFSRGEGGTARVYGEGSGQGILVGGVAGVGESEGEWGLLYDVIGEINTDCSMRLAVEEEWLEGAFCTTVLGQQSCETSQGDEFQLAYGVLEFPYILGPAANIENLSFETGPTTFVTAVEVVPDGQEAANLPEVGGCDFEDLGDD